jgi:hypothetical protein
MFSAAQSQTLSQQTGAKTFSVLNRRNPKGNSPEALFGERLFFETRFAQFFATNCKSDVNQPLTEGDPAVKSVFNPRAGVPYPGPFANKSINCRSCHFVEEFSKYIGGSQRSYTDYVSRSPLPNRGDGRTTTPRNSRSLVDALSPKPGILLLHDDGEFASAEALVKSTITGREFGWLPFEHKQAMAHIARIIREDNGEDELGLKYGGSYSTLLMGTSPEIPAPFLLPVQFRMDTRTASDREILDRIAQLVGAYLKSLEFERDAKGVHTGSAYDRFLLKNNLPNAPAPGESDAEYSQHLSQNLARLQSPKFVQPYERGLRLHSHVFEFGELELKGLKIFLRQNNRPEPHSPEEYRKTFALLIMPTLGTLFFLQCKREKPSIQIRAALVAICSGCLLATCVGTLLAAPGRTGSDTNIDKSHTGNCITCHRAPEFTDFRFHNTGAAQEEYDAVHGEGSFAALKVPSYNERQKLAVRFLPPTPRHPKASGVLRLPPSPDNPQAADLGLWNIYANSDFPEPQARLQSFLCKDKACDPNSVLPTTIGLFRTPSLRNLGHSAPYLHTGQKVTIEQVLHFYMRVSSLAVEGKIRNGDPALAFISLDEDDVSAVAAFLRSLDEDYDN